MARMTAAEGPGFTSFGLAHPCSTNAVSVFAICTIETHLRSLQANLGEPNKAEAEAVDARQELDLKV